MQYLLGLGYRVQCKVTTLYFKAVITLPKFKAQMARLTKFTELISDVDKVYAGNPTPELYKQRMMY